MSENNRICYDMVYFIYKYVYTYGEETGIAVISLNIRVSRESLNFFQYIYNPTGV